MWLRRIAVGGFICRAFVPGDALASDDSELQKKLANPVADIVTVPFQYTGTANVGPGKQWQHALNVQPVYPLKLNRDWTLINRAIVPFLSNPNPGSGDRVGGIGDITYEGFLTPARPAGGWIWGAGAQVALRTATDDVLGQGKYAAGPALILLHQQEKLTVGALVSQIWSFAGDDRRAAVSNFQLQPAISYRLDSKNSLGYAGIITSNWHADSGQRWTVPLGLTWSRLSRVGDTPVNYVLGGGYNVVRPDNAGTWFLRLQMNFVLPK
jgi:hypothetical protein